MPLVWKSSRLRRCSTTSSSMANAIGCSPASRSCPCGAHGVDARLRSDRVDEVGLFALQPQHHRLDAAVPVPGGAQRSEQLAADAGDLG